MMGRPTKYKEEYCDDIVKFFDVEYTREIERKNTDKNGNVSYSTTIIANDLPTLESFAQSIGVNIDTLYEWKKQQTDFSEAVKKAQTMQKAMWQSNSLQGLYRDAFTIFMGKNVFGWTDKLDIATTNQPEQLTPADIRGQIEQRKKTSESGDQEQPK